MSHHTVFDPFLNQHIQICNDLVDRLRGRYAKGPLLPNGEPEFDWSQYERLPIKMEAADEIERLRAEIERLLHTLEEIRTQLD